jgi:drug/metabolite transporter (DMT)-like permease
MCVVSAHCQLARARSSARFSRACPLTPNFCPFLHWQSVLASLTFKSSPISPIVFALLRDIIACACFIPTLLFSQRRVPPEERQLAPLVEHWGLFAALGLLGVFSQMLGALSISLTSALVYGLFSPSVPVITILISFLAGIEVFRPREAASWAKVAGIVACLGGAAAIVLLGSGGSHGSGGGGTLGGYAYLLAATVAKASYPVLQKHMLSRFGYSSLMLATWACALARRLGGCPARRPPLTRVDPAGRLPRALAPSNSRHPSRPPHRRDWCRTDCP